MANYVCDLVFEGAAGPNHLVDSYCGAGSFVISLSSGIEKVVGIELSQSLISSARRNAQLNSTSSDKISFLSGGASNIFTTVNDFLQVIIGPPGRGCDELFLKQLLSCM